MNQISGHYFDGQTSARRPAMLAIADDGTWTLKDRATRVVIAQGASFQATVSPRLGHTPRLISFTGVDHFETEQNDQVDAALALLKIRHWSLPVHLLESKLRFVLIALILFIFGAFGFVRYGIPAAATIIAMNMPQNILDMASSQTMTAFDNLFLTPSKLSQARKEAVLSQFQSVIAQHPGLNLTVLFRNGGALGANAFALPDGSIVFTDELVTLATDNEQLLAILIHEIGHIYYRHGLKRLIQNSILSFALFSLTGDAAGVSELFLGLPVILTELGYSRTFETEADTFALNQMKKLALEPQHFADILLLIDPPASASQKTGKTGAGSRHGWLGYLSTHPATAERIKRFQHTTDQQPL